MSKSLIRLLTLAITIATATTSVGCSSQSPLLKLLSHEDKLTYNATCSTASTAQRKKLQDGDYNPARLFVRNWPASAGQVDGFIGEARLASALELGDVHRVAIFARGGQGKSTLIESLRSQLCTTTPSFVIDLKDLSGTDKPTAETVSLAIAKQVGAVGKQDVHTELADALGTGHFLLFADHIEETEQLRRAATMAALLDFGKRFPMATVVLTARPPVLDADYGFAADATLELPPLECKTSDAFVAKQFKSEAERAQFNQVAGRYGLNEQGRFGVQCTYPYLSTYRDIATLSDFVRRSQGGDVLVSPTSVYEALIAERLKKEFDDLRWTTYDALDMGDRLVRAGSGAVGQHDLRFDMALCDKAIDPKWGEASVDAGVAGNATDRRKQVCEKTFQSAMFQPGEGATYVFADRNTQDLFLGRWLAGEVSRAPGQDCGVIAQHDDLIARPGVTKFLVGQKFGQRCLANVIAQVCKHTDAAAMTAAIELGLPVGKARTPILQEARAAGSNLQPAACIKQVLDDLDKTLAE